jgi:hypothetical protein
MATYKFSATISVTNSRSRHDAINQIQVMLNDYEDMNSSSNKEISISLGASVKEED